MTDIKRILVPTDFSVPAEGALTYAIGLASKFGATVTLLHVFDDPYVAGGVLAAAYVPMPQEMRTEILADLRRRLDDAVARSGSPQVTPQLLDGPIAKTIVAAAQEQGADLIVMGTHGRGAVAHLLLGSVAERVVRTAGCPVLTVRPAAQPA